MSWWHRLRWQKQLDEQLEKELRFHLDQHAADLIAGDLTPEEARRQARIALGGPEQVKEECRDARGTRWLEDLLHDFRYALRTLIQRPGFAAVALLTLALGIGATTVMFTLVDGVLLKPLPYRQPGELLAVFGHTDTWNVALFGRQNLAYLDFLDCRRESRSLDLAGWVYTSGTLSEPGQAERVMQIQVSSNLFSVLGVSLLRGRAFLPAEDKKGGAPVAILGYDMWQTRFGGSSAALGKALVVDEKRYTVVGVVPAEFQLDGNKADVYTPVGQDTARYLQIRGPHPVGGIARLRPGATLPQARAELATIARRLAAQYPDTNKGRGFDAQPLRRNAGDVRSTLWLLLGAVSLVLLIACANVAGLLLARAVSREREFAMRVALGASRGRLARQCLTESGVLGLMGGALGILLAAIGIRPFVALWPGALPSGDEVQIDWRVLLFAVGASLLSGVLFGLAPALRVPARRLEQTLRAGGRSIAGNSRRLHSGLVILEIALAVVLLVSAGMFGRTLIRLSSLNAGIDIRNVLTARMALSPATLADPAQTRAAWQDILDRGRRLPGVRAIAMVDTVPMRSGNNPIGYWTTPVEPAENKKPLVLANSVTPDYLNVMGIRLLEGRFFDSHDRLGNQAVAVIDEVMAHDAFGGRGAVGKRVWIGLGTDPLLVVGVVGHVRYWGPAGDDQALVRAQLYYPFAQVPDRLVHRWSDLMSIAVRTSIPPLNLIETLKREVRGSGNDQVLYAIQTMEQLASDSLARERFLLLLFGVFAGLALLLACIGIYGVLAYLTGQRVPEFGVRMALGANGGDVMRLVLRQSLGMILAGIGVGLAAALATARVLERLVTGMRATEPLTFAAMISLLAAAALLASFIPARRASRVDPLKALRQE